MIDKQNIISLILTKKTGKNNFILSIFLTLLLVHISSGANARSYYFSSSLGNDSYTSTQAQNSATPWKSVTKLNAFFSSLVAGDSILFKRGDIFLGAITVNRSGSLGKPIVLTAYGTGADPVISGFSTLSSWTSAGAGKYQVSASAVTGSRVNMVTLNNVPQPIGRYPNADSVNGGYLTYESFTDTTAITDSELSNATNWTGAEVVIRKRLWVLDRCKVLNHSGTQITYRNPDASSYDGTTNFGYFFQNDPRTLNQLGEWYFDSAKKILQVYFGANTPSAYTTKIATVDILLNIGSSKFITVSNLSFEGANVYGIYASASNTVTVKNTRFTNIGSTGIYLLGTSNILIDSVSTYNMLSNGIWLPCNTDSNAVIRNCSIIKTGTLRGMGESAGNSYKGILADLNTNLTIENNRVDTSGYVGIEFDGSNALIKNNYVNYFCFNKDDAGGIYSWTPGTDATPAGNYIKRVVRDNIVCNGIGAPQGRSSNTLFVSGIYLDGRTMNVDILNNSVFNNGKNGIHCNNPSNVNIIGNTSFNNLNAVSFMRWPWGSISNLTVKNNIFYPKYSTQRNLYYTNAALNEPVTTNVADVIRSLGTFESNYYSTPNETGFNYEIYSASGGTLVPVSPQSFTAWKQFSGLDSNSAKPLREAPPYFLKGLVGSNLFANGMFTSGITGISTFGSTSTAVWDNTSKIAGGSLRVDFSAPVANKYILLHSPVGSVSTSRSYIFRFTTLGTTAYGMVRAYIRKTELPYNSLTPIQVRSFGTSQKVHEFLFTAPETEAGASFVIEVEQNSGTTYIDNVEFYEADATVFNIDDYLRIEYNATQAAKTVALGANYVGADGTYYAGNITLSPFTAKILVKDTSVVRQALAVQATKTAINCFGGNATVTVTASGGIPPYTGTGTFTVAAGTYTYTVKDLTGTSVTTPVTVTQPAAALKVTAVPGVINIYGGNTSVTVSASGGTSPYTGTGVFTNVVAGMYIYTVKDAKGCTASVTINIPQPANALTALAATPGINCFGGSASVTVSATGGKTPYTGTGIFPVTAGAGSLKLSFPSVVSGTYASIYFTIGAISSSRNYVLRFTTLGTTTAGNLRAAIRKTFSPWTVLTTRQTAVYGTSRVDHEFIFNSPPSDSAASFYIEINQNSGTTYIDNIAFFELGSANQLVGSNLVANSTFETGISNTFVYSSNSNHTATWDTSAKINNTYYFTVKDNAGSTAAALVTATQPTLLKAIAAAGTITSFGGATTVTVDANGGTAPYTGTGNFSNVKAGNNIYTITDARGCTANTTITIMQPDPPLAKVITEAKINCFGSAAVVNVTATGGKTPYSGAGSYTVSAGRSSLKISFPISSAATSSSLYYTIGATSAAKKYILRFTTLGTTAAGTFKVALRQTNSPWALITAKQTGTYGTDRKDHEYIFTDALDEATASFIIEINQASGTTYIDNIAFFEATQDSIITGLNLYEAGNFEAGIGRIFSYTSNGNHVVSLDTTSKIGNVYYYVIKDAAGATITSQVNTSQPSAPLQMNITAGAITVAGGATSVTVTAGGGTAPYSGIGTFNNFKAGTYTFKVIDANGCTVSKSITITQVPDAVRRNSNVSSIAAETRVTGKSFSIVASPNPTSAAFNLMVKDGSNDKIKILVINADGKVVYSTIGNSNNKYSFGENFATGVYIIQVMQATEIRTLKLIKIKG